MMNKDNKNDKIQKIVKKGLTLSLCAVLAGGLAAGSFEGMNRLTGWNEGTTVQAASNNENKLTYAKSEKKADEENDLKSDASEDTSDSSTKATGSMDVSDIVAETLPSIVSITTKSVQEVQSYYGMYGMYGYAPQQEEQEVEGSGSGIIVGKNDDELLIATNYHVVSGADTLSVAFVDGNAVEATVKGFDEEKDLAVVSVSLDDIDSDTMDAISVAKVGSSDDLKVGEQVVAIGNALGYGQSVTSGWISAVDREVTDEEGKTTGKLIQTDAAINPGNSGGALLNMQGELIGINSAKAAATEVEGMGYAIPVSVAQPILDELMNRETRYKADEDHAGYIGVTCLNVDSTSAQTYGIPLGAFVDSVEEGGPAQTAGIQKGDVIVKFDGMTVSGSSDLVGKLEYYQAGETVEVVISRAQNGEYQEQTVSVTLGKKSEMKQADPQQGK